MPEPIRANQLLAIIGALPTRAPYSSRFFGSSKDDWLAWLSDYDQPGFYKRNKPGVFAKAAYNFLESPWALVWLAEQLGIPRATPARATRESKLAPKNLASQSGAVRKVIPWQVIEDRLYKQPLFKRQMEIATPAQLRARIKRLSAHTPLTDRFHVAWSKLDPSDWKFSGHNTQQKHWDGWLSGYDGPGGYGRANWNRTAEFVYNHVVNPGLLVYLAEAAGADSSKVRKAMRAAIAKGPTMSSMSGAVRKVISWADVQRCLLA